MELTPAARGVIRLHDLRVTLPDPFTLFQKCTKVSAPPATLIGPAAAFFPAAHRTAGRRRIQNHRRDQHQRDRHLRRIRRAARLPPRRSAAPDPLEKLGAHRPPDRQGTRRHLLSPLWPGARHPVHRPQRRHLRGGGFRGGFVRMLEIDTSESLLDLMFIKNEAHIVTAGRGVERAEKLLEVLAGVTPERSGDFKSLAQSGPPPPRRPHLLPGHPQRLGRCRAPSSSARSRKGDRLRAHRHRQRPAARRSSRPLAGVGQIARDLKRLPARLHQEN
jgi:hypothetical protein